MHKEGYYSSGEFAKKANVTVRTIKSLKDIRHIPSGVQVSQDL